ncbi:hypothetical protein Btru_042862 [Bulinus truncatus]|nr:hypothetical protein Btru_042862 [Bulinus truncatus]
MQFSPTHSTWTPPPIQLGLHHPFNLDPTTHSTWTPPPIQLGPHHPFILDPTTHSSWTPPPIQLGPHHPFNLDPTTHSSWTPPPIQLGPHHPFNLDPTTHSTWTPPPIQLGPHHPFNLDPTTHSSWTPPPIHLGPHHPFILDPTTHSSWTPPPIQLGPHHPFNLDPTTHSTWTPPPIQLGPHHPFILDPTTHSSWTPPPIQLGPHHPFNLDPTTHSSWTPPPIHLGPHHPFNLTPPPIQLGPHHPFILDPTTHSTWTPPPIQLGPHHPFNLDPTTHSTWTPPPIQLGPHHPFNLDPTTHSSWTPPPIHLGPHHPFILDPTTHSTWTPPPIHLGPHHPFILDPTTHSTWTPPPIHLGPHHPFNLDPTTHSSWTPPPIQLGPHHPFILDPTTHSSWTPPPIQLGPHHPFILDPDGRRGCITPISTFCREIFKMKSVLAIILITVLTGVQSSSKNCSRVVCYLLQNAYGFMSPRHVQPDLCTHIVISGISISKISDLNSSRTHWNTNPITGLVKLKKKSDVKILIAIQSSSLSDGFVAMYSSPVERKIFIAALVRILRERNLDGVKIDEQLYPGNKGKFSDFISEIYCEFLKEARESEKTNLILSVGIPVDIPFLEENYDIYSLSDNSDMLDVASYYFKVPNITDNPEHHSPLRSKDPTSTRSIVYVLDHIVTQGCKLDKINVGLSTMCFYYSLTHPGTYSLTDIRGYDMICRKNSILRPVINATILYPETGVLFERYHTPQKTYLRKILLDEEQTLIEKIEYILKNNYGGVVIKALNYDDYSTGYCDRGKLFPLMKAVKKACRL